MLNRPNVGLIYVKSMDFPSYILMIELLLCTKKHGKRWLKDTYMIHGLATRSSKEMFDDPNHFQPLVC